MRGLRLVASTLPVQAFENINVGSERLMDLDGDARFDLVVICPGGAIDFLFRNIGTNAAPIFNGELRLDINCTIKDCDNVATLAHIAALTNAMPSREQPCESTVFASECIVTCADGYDLRLGTDAVPRALDTHWHADCVPRGGMSTRGPGYSERRLELWYLGSHCRR